MRVHIPYIIGFVDNISNHFKYFTGADCMEKFIVHLFSYSKESKLYINAYNGSKFDHYEFINQHSKRFTMSMEV
jgi:NADPH-dependent 7-cyano-7-deazaguanine reductase QueF-like protein